MVKVSKRYNSHLNVKKFDNLTIMLDILRKDFKTNVNKRCGKYIGTF